MEEDQALTMFQDANIGVQAAHIIQKKSWLILAQASLPPRARFDDKLGNNALPQTIKQVKCKDPWYDYRYHKVDQIIKHNLALQLLSSSTVLDWSIETIFFGGDHGQQAFQLGFKLVLRGQSKMVK
jgi:hypothetical protein